MFDENRVLCAEMLLSKFFVDKKKYNGERGDALC